MFDIFGLNKIDAKQAVQEIMCGATRGLLEGFEFRLEEKNREIQRLTEKLTQHEDLKKKYTKLINSIEKDNKEKKGEKLNSSHN